MPVALIRSLAKNLKQAKVRGRFLTPAQKYETGCLGDKINRSLKIRNERRYGEVLTQTWFVSFLALNL